MTRQSQGEPSSNFRYPVLTRLWTSHKRWPVPASTKTARLSPRLTLSQSGVLQDSSPASSRVTHGTEWMKLGSHPIHRPILPQPLKNGNGRNVYGF